MSPQLVSVSRDSRRIAFATNAGLYIYDVENREKTTLIDLWDDNAQKRLGLALFDQIAFVDGGNRIAFKSQRP